MSAKKFVGACRKFVPFTKRFYEGGCPQGRRGQFVGTKFKDYNVWETLKG